MNYASTNILLQYRFENENQIAPSQVSHCVTRDRKCQTPVPCANKAMCAQWDDTQRRVK